MDVEVPTSEEETGPATVRRVPPGLFRVFLHVSSCSGGVSERILARKGAFDAPDRDLAGGVRCSAAAQALKEISRSALKWIEKTWLAKFVKKC